MPIPAAAAHVAGQVVADTAGKAGGALLSTLGNAMRNGTAISSLADLARPARVEPLAIIDKPLLNQPYMEDIMKFSLTTFTGYYLQAVSMLMNVGRIDTLKVFDTLNPYRSQGSVKDAIFSQEAYKDGLPSLESFTQRAEHGLIASLEANQEDQTEDRQSMSAEVPGKLYEVESLAVGKLLSIELRDGNTSQKLPVLVRLLPAAVPTQALTHIFTAGGRSSWSDRWQLYRAGQIRLVRDLMLGLDLIDEHKKALANDTSGVYEQITDRRRNNAKKAALTGNVSMADASNIAIITSETAKQVSRGLYGKLDNMAVRQKIFDNTYLLLLIVVDERWEQITVYHRGLDMASTYTFKEIKSAEKNKGPDITEIFKLFHQNMGSNI